MDLVKEACEKLCVLTWKNKVNPQTTCHRLVPVLSVKYCLVKRVMSFATPFCCIVSCFNISQCIVTGAGLLFSLKVRLK